MYVKQIGLIVLALMWPYAVAQNATYVSSSGASLLPHKACLGCHQVHGHRVGPPFAAVAQRYRDQPQAEAYLATAIRQGSRHRWGKLAMPAQPQVSPEEAADIARWILSLAEAPQKP
jgi:cytochrome c